MQLRELEITLVKLIREGLDISQAEDVIESFLTESPQRSIEVFHILNEYLENDLIDLNQFTHLVRFTRKCSSAKTIKKIPSPDAPDNITNDEDKTVIAKDADRTFIKKEPDKATFDDSDKTVMSNPRATKHREQNEEPEEKSSPLTHLTSPSFPTDNSWSKPFSDGQSETRLGVGSIIKDRFKLIKFIGRGGMGDVYKAEDLRRTDANDVELEVAIKLLNKEFKEHPDSLRALQREARKTQSLAHPHIVNVHDFDRDQSHVFMTMEYMDGEPLNEVLKLNVAGLEYSLATKLIEELCSALQYAHRRGVIHSDLKPSNIFLTKNNELKVFDFGIARAANIIEDGITAKDTFDAGDLGALTPAYASPEMLEGEHEPSVCDDMYALGCIVYEVYTGRHPFFYNGKKLPADEAKKLGLSPPKVKGFSKRQQAALEKTLAFERLNRTKCVEEFVDEFLTKKSLVTPKRLLTGFTVIILALALIWVIFDYHEKKDAKELLHYIAVEDEPQVKEQIQLLMTLEKGQRDRVLKNHKVSFELKRYLRSLAQNQASDDHYESALQTLELAQKVYPDSREIYDLTQQTSEAQKERIKELIDKLDTIFLNRTTIIANDNQILDLLQTLHNVQSDNKQIANLRPLFKLQEAVEYLLSQNELIAAKNLLKSAQFIIDEFAGFGEFEAAFTVLNEKLEYVFAEERRKMRTAQLLEEVKLNNDSELQQVLQYQPQLSELIEISPDAPEVTSLRQIVASKIDSALPKSIENQNWDDAQDLLSYALIVDQSIAEKYAQKLKTARAEYDSTLANQISEIEQLANNAQPQRATELFTNFDRSLVTEDELNQLQNSVARSWLNLARMKKENRQWGEAKAAIGQGLALARSTALKQELNNEELEIAQANQELAIEEAQPASSPRENREDENITQLAKSIRLIISQPTLSIADINTLQTNLQSLENVRPDHPLIYQTRSQTTKKIREQIAQGITTNTLKDTLQFAENVYAAHPQFVFLGDEIEHLKGLLAEPNQREQREQLALQRMNITTTVAQADELLDFTLIEQLIADYKENQPQAADINQLNDTVNAKLKELANQSVNNLRFNQAREYLLLGEHFNMPQDEIDRLSDAINSEELSTQNQTTRSVGSLYERILAYLNANDLMKADAALAEFKNTEEVSLEQLKRIDDAYYQAFLKLSNEAYEKLDLTSANFWLAKAQDIKPDENQIFSLQAKYRAVNTILNTRTSNSALAQKLKISATSMYPDDTVIENIEIDGAESYIPQATSKNDTAVSTGSSSSGTSGSISCSRQMAGKGNVSMCRDALTATFNGPYLVVLPPLYGESMAITKYEVSVGEYNTYCSETGNCAPLVADKLMPVTGLNMTQINNFIQWISDVTQSTYRLPSIFEWRFAAQADEQYQPEVVNCSVAGRSTRLQPINYEKVNTSNSWGVTNYLGNAQEIVTQDNQYATVGGHFKDDLSRCTVYFSRPLDGVPDQLTGFRLIKELD